MNSFIQQEDKKRALVSRLLQRKAVLETCVSSGVVKTYADARIRLTKGRKPYTVNVKPADAPNWNFNVSHEGHFTALASEPFCVCGLDVSAPRQLRVPDGKSLLEAVRLVKENFAPSEVTTVVASMAKHFSERLNLPVGSNRKLLRGRTSYGVCFSTALELEGGQLINVVFTVPPSSNIQDIPHSLTSRQGGTGSALSRSVARNLSLKKTTFATASLPQSMLTGAGSTGGVFKSIAWAVREEASVTGRAWQEDRLRTLWMR